MALRVVGFLFECVRLLCSAPSYRCVSLALAIMLILLLLFTLHLWIARTENSLLRVYVCARGCSRLLLICFVFFFLLFLFTSLFYSHIHLSRPWTFVGIRSNATCSSIDTFGYVSFASSSLFLLWMWMCEREPTLVYGTTFIRCDVNVIGINPINNRGSLPTAKCKRPFAYSIHSYITHIIDLVTGQFHFEHSKCIRSRCYSTTSFCMYSSSSSRSTTA